jgi:uncharacterized protein
MPTPVRTITVSTARRLALSRQRLCGPRPPGDAPGIMEIVRRLNCLQLDPISVVARSHELVLWSRLGSYDRAALDRLLWEERALFEYWAHGASIVLTEDYPVHRLLMRSYPSGRTARSRRVQEWLEANRDLRHSILLRLRRKGPLPARALEDASQVGWTAGGWTDDRNVNEMLDVLWTQGFVMVAGRRGGQKLWDLSERCLPDWTPRERLGPLQATRRAAELSLRSLGVATAGHIRGNFTQRRYPGFERILVRMLREGSVVPVGVEDPRGRLPGVWLVHAEDVGMLDRLEAGVCQPRTTLLSPFDNLIRDRARMELLFDFDYRMEIYVPKAKRRYGYYVLPVLHGERLIGRTDLAMDRRREVLVVRAAHAEPGAPATKTAARAVARAVKELAGFLGARGIEVEGVAPDLWRAALHASP